MSYSLNLQLKDGIQPEKLLEFGFIPKYDEDTGEIKEYYRKFKIDEDRNRHFTFILHRDFRNGLFKRVSYSAWMSGFNWSSVATTECMQLLYDLFMNGIVEPTKKVVEHNDR